MTIDVLIVDDEPHMARLAALILEKKAGYQVLTAQSAPQALAILEHEKPALLLCDIMMPEMDGLTLLRKIRADPRTAELPVIIFTVKGRPQDRLDAAEAGANGYLTKPFSSSQVLAEVARHLPAPVADGR